MYLLTRLLAGFCLLTWPSFAAAKVYLNTSEDLRLYVVGVAELDAIYDSSRSYSEVTGNGPIALANSADGGHGRVQFSSRDSRFGLGVETKHAAGISTHSYVEIDFAGYSPPASASGSEADFYDSSSARLRLYYFTVANAEWQLLVGESWSLFGWEQEYVPSTVAVRPATGAAYERVPQVQLRRTLTGPQAWSVQIAAAVSRPPQAASASAAVEAGIRLLYGGRLAPYTATATGDVTAAGASLGLSSTTRELVYPQTAYPQEGAGLRQSRVVASAYAVDARLPLIGVAPGAALVNTLVLVGELTRGRGNGDEFSGWTGNVQSLNSTAAGPSPAPVDAGTAGYSASGNFTPLQLSSFDVTMQYHAPGSWHAWATLGYGELSSDNAAALRPTSGKQVYTRADEAFVNVVHNVTQEIRLGIEASRNVVRYVDHSLGVDRRLQLSTWYRF